MARSRGGESSHSLETPKRAAGLIFDDVGRGAVSAAERQFPSGPVDTPRGRDLIGPEVSIRLRTIPVLPEDIHAYEEVWRERVRCRDTETDSLGLLQIDVRKIVRPVFYYLQERQGGIWRLGRVTESRGRHQLVIAERIRSTPPVGHDTPLPTDLTPPPLAYVGSSHAEYVTSNCFAFRSLSAG